MNATTGKEQRFENVQAFKRDRYDRIRLHKKVRSTDAFKSEVRFILEKWNTYASDVPTFFYMLDANGEMISGIPSERVRWKSFTSTTYPAGYFALRSHRFEVVEVSR
jgi:hypothetical protein